MSTESRVIWIITEDTSGGEPSGARDGRTDTGGLIDSQYLNSGVRRYSVKVDALKQEMSEFLKLVDEIFSQFEVHHSELQLDEVELNIEVNGQGQVSLLGFGAGVGSKGSIKLKLKRGKSTTPPQADGV